MDKLTDLVATVVVVFVFGVILLMLMAFPTMWLWNFVMPDIFGLPTITFWQALSLNLLSAILFKPMQYNSKDK